MVAVAAGVYHNLALRSGGTVLAWGDNSAGQATVPAGLAGVVAVAAGHKHSLALLANGTVVAWGSNQEGQAAVPPGLASVVAVAAGWNHNLALQSDGTVVAWGDNSAGQAAVPADLSDVTAVAAGRFHSMALRRDGTVAVWGAYAIGGTNLPASSPDWLSDIVAIAAGENHSLALRRDGSVVAWGVNDSGQTNVPPVLTNAIAIAAGRCHNVALVFSGPPQILSEPCSRDAVWDSNINYQVTAVGKEPLAYQWRFNGVALTNSDRIAGVNGPTLTVNSLQFSDAGLYDVVVSNPFGAVASSGAVLRVIGRPILTTRPTDQTVRAGADVVFRVIAEGTPPLSYRWFYNGAPLPGQSSALLSLPNVQPDQSGDYQVEVANSWGSTQSLARLTVTDSPPYITVQPYCQLWDQRSAPCGIVPIHSTVTLYAAARGSRPLTYQWRVNGQDIPGATADRLTLVDVSPSDTGYYGLEIANAFGVTNSAKLLLNVSQVAVAGAPMVGNTNMPLGLSGVTALAAGGLHVMALKTDGTVRTWLLNPLYSSYDTYLVTNIPASATNVIAMAAGYNHCLALRSNGTVVAWGSGYLQGSKTNVPTGLSNVVSIAAGSSYNYAVKADGTVTGWGSSATAPAGLSNVVAVACMSPQNLALRRDGTVASWTGTGPFTVVPGLSNAIAVAASSTECRALCADGTVVRWPATTPSQPTLVMEGNLPVSNAVAIALGAGRSSLILKQDGTVVSEGLGPLPVTNHIAGIAAGGSSTGFGVLLVGSGAPAITLHPVSQSVLQSNTVTLHARAAGLPPLTFQWQHDGVNLPGATNASLTLPQAAGHAGGYWLIASNALGTVTSRLAIVSVPFATNLPAALNATNLTWTTWSVPASGQNVSYNGWAAQNRETHDDDVAAQSGPISHGQQSVLETVVTGPGTLSFWWKVSSEAAYDFLRFYWNNTFFPFASLSGETDWQQIRLTLGDGQHRLRWVYAKDASVSLGRDAGWVDEVVFTPAPPRIVQHPVDQTVPAGATVTFQVSASSPAPMTYQWLKNGTNLAGATAAELTLTNVTRRDAGLYAVCVANAGGSVTSSNATLSVMVPQKLVGPVRWPDGSFGFRSSDADGGLLDVNDVDRFEVLVSSNLLTWRPVSNVLVLTNGVLVVRDPESARLPVRFYRLLER